MTATATATILITKPLLLPPTQPPTHQQQQAICVINPQTPLLFRVLHLQ